MGKTVTDKKDDSITFRISKELKYKFAEKLNSDGLTQSDFIISCIINYLGIKTVSEELIKRGKNNK